MNDFIKLHYANTQEEICIRKEKIYRFKESEIVKNISPEKCTQIFLSENYEDWIKVSETVDEIMEMLEHE